MTAPIEIPVRLAADDTGVVTAIKELAAQLRAVTGPATAAGRALDQTAKATERTEQAAKSAVSGFQGLARGLQALGGFLLARRLARFAGEVLETADAIGNLSEKTGLATETLSTLAFAGRTANVDITGLDTAFRGFNKSLVGLAQGSKESAKSFALIGLSLKDLQGLTVDQALAKTIDAFNALPDGPRKAAAAVAVFGKAGSDLIPLLNEIAGRGGMAGVTEEARKVGLVFDRDAVQAAKRFKDQMALLQAALQGAAFELSRGLLPSLTSAVSGLRSFLAEHPNLRRFAANLTALAAAFVALGAALAGLRLLQFGLLIKNPVFLALVGVGALVAGINTLNQATAAAQAGYKDYLNTLSDTRALDAQSDALQRRRDQILADISAVEKAKAARETARSKSVLARDFIGLDLAAGADEKRLKILRENLAFVDGQLRDINARKVELGKPLPGAFDEGIVTALEGAKEKRDRFRDTELAAEQERLRIEEVQLKDSYDQRLITVEEFFARRRDIMERMAALEVASLEKELAQAEPDERPAIEGRIAARRLQLEREILELRIEQRRESEKVAEEEAKAAKERFQGVLDQARRVQNDVARQRERIQQLVVTGSVSERQGEAAIAAIEQSRLPVLTALADQAARMAVALGPDAVEQAQALDAEIQRMRVNAELAAREMAKLRSTLETDVEGGIAAFLRDPTQPLEALRGMLQAVQGTLADFFAKKIGDVLFSRGDAAAQLAAAGAALTPAGASLTTAGTTLTAASPALTTSAAALTSSGHILFASAGALQAAAASLAAANAAGGGSGGVDWQALGNQLLASGFARGGAVPGFGFRDTVPAWLRPGEHVLTPEEVRAAGGHGAILAWRRALLGGLPPAPPVRLAGVRRFATGGPVFPGPSAGGGEFTLRGEIGLEDGLVMRLLESPEGERAFLKVARRNRKALSGLMPRRAP